MIKIEDFNEQNANNDTIILGEFKTLHLGHQKLLKQIAPNDKVSLLRINKGEQIFSNFELEHIVANYNYNIQTIIELDFTQIKDMSHLDFMQILLNANIKKIICGSDFAFGKNRQGKIADLQANFEVVVVDITSNKIATKNIIEKLHQGDLAYFKQAHGFDYFVFSKVIHGDQIGRTIDFPTINFDVCTKIVPKFGVYVAQISFNNQIYQGCTYIGSRPTLNKITTRFETNIFDFSQEVYGQNMKITLLDSIRGEKKFTSITNLKNQIIKDVENAKL